MADPKSQRENLANRADITIQLLALVTSASAALGEFATNLNRNLTELLTKSPSNALTARGLLLNVIPVNECEFKNSLGYDVLLSSIDVQMQEIWQRVQK